jgi:putative ABC transport system permease protein
MDYLIRYQFDEVQREDVTVHLAREYGKDALYDLARLEYVREAEPMLQYPFEMRHGWRKKDIAIVGLPRNADLRHLAGVDGAPVDLGEEGLVLSEKLADALGATVGDVIDLEPLMGRIEGVRRAPVTQIVQQYLGMSAYMNIEALSRLLEESLALNAALLRTERGRADDVNEGLKDVAGVASVEIKSNTLDNINKSIGEFMGITTAITVFFAGVIAFSIIYNVTSVSLAERERELASLRVLGFTTQEVGRVLYYENFCLAGLGVFLGLPLGYALTAAIVDAYNTEIYRLPLYVEPMSYVAAAFYSLVFVVLSNLAVRRRVARLDIIDVLKSRE